MIIDCISEIEHLKIEDGDFLVVKVGSDDRPATHQDLIDIQDGIAALKLDNLKYLVTHHLVDFKLYSCDKGHSRRESDDGN